MFIKYLDAYIVCFTFLKLRKLRPKIKKIKKKNGMTGYYAVSEETIHLKRELKFHFIWKIL